MERGMRSGVFSEVQKRNERSAKKKSRLDKAATSPMTTKPDGELP
jgi:hypothetical protein